MKTRAFDPIEKRWREDYIVSPAGSIFQTTHYKMDLWELEARPNWKLSRFTGLLDKNGEEIYEGDVVIMWYDLIERWSAPLLVTFDVLVIEDDFGATWEPMCWRAGDSELSGICEIVGNIHENPELLEEVTK